MTYCIIIDTNVIISAMLKKNTPPSEILKEVFSGNVIPVVNDEILTKVSKKSPTSVGGG